jgi:hypothetical protein
MIHIPEMILKSTERWNVCWKWFSWNGTMTIGVFVVYVNITRSNPVENITDLSEILNSRDIKRIINESD